MDVASADRTKRLLRDFDGRHAHFARALLLTMSVRTFIRPPLGTP
jgi:hypothetical protein